MVSPRASGASPFVITTAANKITLDATRKATVVFSVTAGALGLAGRPVVRPDKPEFAAWYSVAESEYQFRSDETVPFHVTVAPPLTATAGPYSFQLAMVGKIDTDEQTVVSPAVAYDLLPVPVAKPTPWLLIGIIAAVVVAAFVGAMLYFLVFSGGGGAKQPVTGSVSYAASGTLDLDKANSAPPTAASGSDDLQYLVAGSSHTVVTINNARLVRKQTAALTADECNTAAQDKSASLGFATLDGTGATPFLCVVTNDGRVAAISVTLSTKTVTSGSGLAVKQVVSQDLVRRASDLNIIVLSTFVKAPTATPVPTGTTVTVASISYNSNPQ